MEIPHSKYEDLVARLERCEMELQASRGYIKALECGLHSMVACSPNPGALRELWVHVLADAPDHMENGGALYHAAFQHSLAKMTEVVESSVERDQDSA